MTEQIVKVKWKTFQAAAFDGIPLPNLVRVAKRLRKAGRAKEADSLLYLVGAVLYQNASATKAPKR
jgi:hypothetical protein